MRGRSASWMELPRRVVAGAGALEDIGDVCVDLRLSGRAVVVTGPQTRSVAGENLAAHLAESGFEAEVVITRDSRPAEVDRVKSFALDFKADFLVGAGGGRSIDIAKLAAFQLDIPYLSVPTAASHDGIASAMASLNMDGETKSIPTRAPLAIIADTGIISKAPPRLMSAGCGDIISNYTAILDWKLAKRLRCEDYSEYAAALSSMTARMLVDMAPSIKPGHEPSTKVVVQALISSGVAMSIAGSSRPASGSEHMFAHALNRIAPGCGLHGELCGMGTIIMMYLHGGDWRMIRETLQVLGAPTSAHELKIPEDVVVQALTQAHTIRPERYTILGNGLTEAAARAAAETTKVI